MIIHIEPSLNEDFLQIERVEKSNPYAISVFVKTKEKYLDYDIGSHWSAEYSGQMINFHTHYEYEDGIPDNFEIISLIFETEDFEVDKIAVVALKYGYQIILLRDVFNEGEEMDWEEIVWVSEEK